MRIGRVVQKGFACFCFTDAGSGSFDACFGLAESQNSFCSEAEGQVGSRCKCRSSILDDRVLVVISAETCDQNLQGEPGTL